RQSVQSPSPNRSTQRVAPSVSAARARTSSRGRDPVTARADTDGSAAAVKKPPSRLRTVASTSASVASAERGSRASRSSSTAVTAPPADSTSSAESESTRYSTSPGDQRASTTVACGVRGGERSQVSAWAAAVREIARASRSARGASGSETVSSDRAPPRREVNQGTEWRQPVPSRGGVTPSSTTRAPPSPEAGRPTLAKYSLGLPASPGSETSSVRIRPVCTSPSQQPRNGADPPRIPTPTQVRCLVWDVMQRCGNAWRRILPPPAADVQPACPQRPLCTAAELAHQLPSDVHSFEWRVR